MSDVQHKLDGYNDYQIGKQIINYLNFQKKVINYLLITESPNIVYDYWIETW